MLNLHEDLLDIVHLLRAAKFLREQRRTPHLKLLLAFCDHLTFLPIAMSVHLNYNQAFGHLLLHDLLITHGGLRHLQDTVQDGGSKCSRFSRCSSCSPVQGSEVGPCLPEFTLLTRLFLLHLVDCAVAINKDNKGSHPLIFFLQ